MNQGPRCFSQLISFLPDRQFRRRVESSKGDIQLRELSCETPVSPPPLASWLRSNAGSPPSPKNKSRAAFTAAQRNSKTPSATFLQVAEKLLLIHRARLLRKQHARHGSSAKPHVQLFVAGSAGAEDHPLRAMRERGMELCGLCRRGWTACRRASHELPIKPIRTRIYTPRTNGKAERFKPPSASGPTQALSELG